MNDIKARQHKYWRLIGVFIFVVGTISVLFTVIGLAAGLNSIYAIEALAGFVVVPYLIYEGIKSHQEQRVNYFNAKRYG
ncbi:hypothetical protein [Fulvivirga kasyanovii]|uniref:Uncharacterized protein n=1 Tax=Fulvivirga kasyanovii TaxID=396812 RepID=A0ABW9RQB1_9BACT|nr:hypothetical protein [Fulvivirga kasyanovii]MTI25488.1 hypothetical protein [Fulvivirga kasyanovii]